MRMILTLITVLLCAACSDASSDSDGSGDGFQVVGFEQDSATGDVPIDTVAGDAALDVMASDAAVLDAPVDTSSTDATADGAPAPSDSNGGQATPEVVEDVGPPPCEPDCENAECGDDGCGGLCGACEEGELCSEDGLCEADPDAGCGGLDLAENWEGTFDGVYDASVLGGLVDALEGPTSGELAFSLTCLNSKYIINGELSGLASDKNPFELTLTGTYNPTTKELKGTIPDGTVVLVEYVNTSIDFAGEIPGFLQPGGTFEGSYHVDATGGSSLIGALDLSQISASSTGTWTAAPVP